MQALITNKYVAGAIAGLVAAAIIDIQAFRAWQSVQDAIAYDWRLAAWRWLQGAVSGALMAAGLSGMS
jgi:methyl coenzyme M reductase beta subunit